MTTSWWSTWSMPHCCRRLHVVMMLPGGLRSVGQGLCVCVFVYCFDYYSIEVDYFFLASKKGFV